MRITSVELHQKLGQAVDQARLEPVTVTKHDRDHVVILSAEAYQSLRKSARRVRLTGSLTASERAAAAAAAVPSKAVRKRHLDALAVAATAETARRKKP